MRQCLFCRGFLVDVESLRELDITRACACGALYIRTRGSSEQQGPYGVRFPEMDCSECQARDVFAGQILHTVTRGAPFTVDDFDVRCQSTQRPVRITVVNGRAAAESMQ